MQQILVAFMLGEGIVFGVLAVIMFRRKRAQLALCHRTFGEVIDVKERSGGEISTRHPVIRYRAASGDDVTFESKFGSSNCRLKPGDRLEIWVGPGASTDAEIVSFMAQWGLPFILASVAAVSIIGAPVVFVVLRP
jgi:hypothetical protein